MNRNVWMSINFATPCPCGGKFGNDRCGWCSLGHEVVQGVDWVTSITVGLRVNMHVVRRCRAANWMATRLATASGMVLWCIKRMRDTD